MISGVGASRAEVLRYYYDARQLSWTAGRSLHFGYWRPGLSPLRLDPMQGEMTRQVLDLLEPLHPGDRVVDLGSGAGAAAREALARWPRVRWLGVDLAPWHLTEARSSVVGDGRSASFAPVCADFRRAPFGDDSCAAALLLEAASHGDGRDKRSLLLEAARLLRPGGVLAIADGFLKGSLPRGPAGRIYRRLCRTWAIDTLPLLDEMLAALSASGFVEIEWREISWHLLPSAGLIQLAAVRHLLRRLLPGGPSRPVATRYLWAALLAPAVGLMRWRFGYYLIRARFGPATDDRSGGSDRSPCR